MAPLVVLVVAVFLARLMGRLGVGHLRDWAASTRVGLAVMLCFTAAAHFNSMRPDMVDMVPPGVPNPEFMVTFTGICEILGAIGLLVPRTRRVAAVALIVFLLAVLPANIHAARAGVTLRGNPATPIVPRVALQALFIGLLWWSGLQRPAGRDKVRATSGGSVHRYTSILCTLVLSLAASAASGDDGSRLISLDHYVRVKSTAPAMTGQEAQIYVRELVLAGTALRGGPAPDRVVLFVHGAGTPAEVAFDVPRQDYSWMAYLAQAGFDVFSMDMTGYGRSTRPSAMNDPCNVSKEQQAQFVPTLIPAPCATAQSTPITTIASDWNDIGAVVDHLRALRRVDKVSLVGWSQGGPRAGGYAARNPAKVGRLVVLAPAYNRTSPLDAPNPLPANAPMTVQSLADFTANWDRQVGCPEQYEPAVSAAVWSGMLASDPVGATWGMGVRRAPQVPTWGFNQAVVGKMQTPFLMVAGIHDKQVAPERVRELYADLGSKQKVIVDLGCSSHNAMWEKNRLLLFKASLEWLRDGKVNGLSEGEVKLGY